MYSVSSDFNKAVLNNARRIEAHIVFKEKSYDIQKCTVDNNIYSTDNDAFIGTFIAKSGTIKINKQDLLQLENESFNLFFGIQLADGTIENVPVGTMNVYEKTSDTEFKFMDNKMFFNRKFDTETLTYPSTPLKAALEACRQAGVELATLDFLNKDINIPSEVFFGYDATCGDVITAVAQASCTFATINRENKLEFRWFRNVDFTIPLDNQYKYPTIETAYGPINSLVLAREPQNDNVYIQDDESIKSNGLTELKFSDNPFLDIDRYTSRNAIWNRVNGFKYIPFIASVPGQFHLDIGDVIKLQIEDGAYINAYMMNHSMSYAGGIKSEFSTPALTKSQINYSVASTLESKILRTELTVDKIKGEINSRIQEITNKIENIDTSLYRANLNASATVLNERNTSITLTCQVLNGTTDITADQADIQFQWYRNDEKFKTGKLVTLSNDDIDVSANFKCIVTVDGTELDTGNITITDNNDIANLGNSFLDVTGSQLVQILNTDGTYSPNWEINNITITPAVLDGLLNVDLSNCDIVFKKIINSSETGLTNGENVSNGILNVSKNIMTKANPAVTYVCYVSYKNTSIKLFTSFSLNVLGKDGADGSDGKDGAVGPQGPTGDDGVSVISITPYFAVNASSTTPPDSGWITAQPVRANGQYLWRKDTTKFSNNTTSTTIPFVITGDKGDDGTVHSATAPSDKTKLWFDTTDNLLKYWNGTTWEVTNDFAGDINDMKQNITTEYTSAINQLKESLTTLVEKLQTTTTDNSTLIEQLSSQIVQNSSSISLVTNSIKSITDNISGLATKEEISQWARFQDGVLELGASNSPFAVKLSNTELGFYQNGSRIAYLSNQQLNIEYAIVMTKLNIGTFSWNYDATDGLTLT